MTAPSNQQTTTEQWIRGYQADSFSKQSSNEWYGVTGDNEALAARKQAKLEFLADDSLRAPRLQYPRLETIDYRRSERDYQQLLSDAEALDSDETSDVLYEQAARKLAELYRHKEVSRRVGGVTNAALSRERASLMTQELFGAPERDDFAHLLKAARDKASVLEDGSKEAREFLELTGDVSPESQLPNYELRDETLDAFKADLNTLFPGFGELLDNSPKTEITPETAIDFMQHMLDFAGPGAAGWKAKLVVGTVAASTSETDRTITVGRDRAAKFTPEGLRKTAVHECFGHALRIFLTGQQTEPLKQQSQAGNLAFEEGFATGLEQVVSGEKRIAGVQYYLSLGLQLGLDRAGEKRDFRDIFEVVWRRIVVDNLAAGKEPEIEKARESAYLQCMRTTRGGALDARDISYFTGAKKAYTWMNEIAALPEPERLEAIATVFSGRFDASNPAQAALYSQEKADSGSSSV